MFGAEEVGKVHAYKGTINAKPYMQEQASYFSNATTKDQSYEIERLNKIMAEPIENLLSNLSSYNIRASTANTNMGRRPSSGIKQGVSYYDSGNDNSALDERRAATAQARSRPMGQKRSRMLGQQNRITGGSSKDRSFSIKAGKLVLNPSGKGESEPALVNQSNYY